MSPPKNEDDNDDDDDDDDDDDAEDSSNPTDVSFSPKSNGLFHVTGMFFLSYLHSSLDSTESIKKWVFSMLVC